MESGEINERQHKGLLHAQEHGTIAGREYVALTGVSERTAGNDLAALVRRGLLEPAGGRGRRTAYRLRDHADGESYNNGAMGCTMSTAVSGASHGQQRSHMTRVLPTGGMCNWSSLYWRGGA